MPTTLDIDEEVPATAKEIARRQRTTAGAVISELARRALTQPGPEPRSAAREPQPFFGFRPLATGGGVVSDDAVERLRAE